MEIKIKKIDTQTINSNGGVPGVTDTYRVIDNGNEFNITFRSHGHGSNLIIVGQEGILYTDKDSNTVRRQVLAVGRGCGISIESDELVEKLSPWSIRGIMLADRSKETREITITTERPESTGNQPVVLIDGKITDLHQGLL